MRRERVQVFGAVINGEYHGKPEQVQSNGELTARRVKGRGQSPFSFFLGRSTLPSATLGHKTAHPPFSGTKVSYEIYTNMIYPGPG